MREREREGEYDFGWSGHGLTKRPGPVTPLGQSVKRVGTWMIQNRMVTDAIFLCSLPTNSKFDAPWCQHPILPCCHHRETALSWHHRPCPGFECPACANPSVTVQDEWPPTWELPSPKFLSGRIRGCRPLAPCPASTSLHRPLTPPTPSFLGPSIPSRMSIPARRPLPLS